MIQSADELATGVTHDQSGDFFVTGTTSGKLFISKYSNGTPSIELDTKNNRQHAFFISGNNSNTLAFNYTVKPNDNSSDLNYFSVNSFF